MNKAVHLSVFALMQLALATAALAQPMSAYQFSSSTQAYAPILGTVLGDNTNALVAFNDLPLGFTFNYGGVDYTTASVASNGFVKLGGPANGFQLSPMASFEAQDSVICVFGAYLRSTPSGELSYLTSGTAPDRVFTVQWTDYSGGSFFGETSEHAFDFQLRLHETSNTIEFHYGDFVLNPTGGEVYASIGLRGNVFAEPTDFQTRGADGFTTTWEASMPGDIYTYCLVSNGPPSFTPPTGLLYTWTLAAPCTGTPAVGVVAASSEMVCIGRPIQLTATGSSPYAPGITYTWETSADGSSWTPGNPQTTSTLNTTLAAPTYYRLVQACNGSGSTSNVVFVDAVPAPEYAAVPFAEDFDATWEDRCDPESVPTVANWSSNPTTGYLAWRGLLPADLFGTVPDFSGKAAMFNSVIAEGSSTEDGFTGDLDLYVDLGDADLDYTLSFYFVNPPTDEFIDDSLQVMLSTDGGDSFQMLATYNTAFLEPINAQWNKKTIALGSGPSATSIVRFRGHADGSFYYLAVDSLEINACAAPDLEVTSSDPDFICVGASATLTATGGSEYLWSTGETTSSITVTPIVTTTYSVTATDGGCSIMEEIIQVVDPCLGIHEDGRLMVSATPNPTHGAVTVRFADAALRVIRLMDATGRELARWRAASAQMELDLSAHASGVYMLCIEDSEGKQNLRVVRE